jgi:hypothetical protein
MRISLGIYFVRCARSVYRAPCFGKRKNKIPNQWVVLVLLITTLFLCLCILPSILKFSQKNLYKNCNVQGVSKRAFQWYSKCCCVESVTKTF